MKVLCDTQISDDLEVLRTIKQQGAFQRRFATAAAAAINFATNGVKIGEYTIPSASNNIVLAGKITFQNSQHVAAIDFTVGLRSSALPTKLLSISQKQTTNGVVAVFPVLKLYEDLTSGRVVLGVTAASGTFQSMGWLINTFERADYDGYTNTPNLVALDTTGLTEFVGSSTLNVIDTGAAGGDLAGSYPNPSVGALAITDAKVAAANKDGLAAVPSLRTLGIGAQQAASGTDSRFGAPSPPNGAAGGDLAGTYPNPDLRSVPYVRATAAGGNSLALGDNIALVFNAAAQQSSRYTTMWVAGGSANTIVIPRDGFYMLTAFVTWTSAATAGARQIWIRLNNTTGLAYNVVPVVSGLETRQTLSCMYKFAQADFVELMINAINSAGVIGSGLPPSFSVAFVSAS